MGLFGSYARGDHNEGSDIDILVDFNDRVGIAFIELAHELEDLFQTKVDLVSRKGIKIAFTFRLLKKPKFMS